MSVTRIWHMEETDDRVERFVRTSLGTKATSIHLRFRGSLQTSRGFIATIVQQRSLDPYRPTGSLSWPIPLIVSNNAEYQFQSAIHIAHLRSAPSSWSLPLWAASPRQAHRRPNHLSPSPSRAAQERSHTAKVLFRPDSSQFSMLSLEQISWISSMPAALGILLHACQEVTNESHNAHGVAGSDTLANSNSTTTLGSTPSILRPRDHSKSMPFHEVSGTVQATAGQRHRHSGITTAEPLV